MGTVSMEPLVERLRVALGQGRRPLDTAAVKDTVGALHPADLALVMDELTLPEALAVFRLLNDGPAAEVLDEVSPVTNRYLVENSPPERIVALLNRLPMDDAAEVVAEVGAEEAEPLVADLPAPEAAAVRELLAYPEGTAGRLMTRRFAMVRPPRRRPRPSSTCATAPQTWRRSTSSTGSTRGAASRASVPSAISCSPRRSSRSAR